MGIMGPSLVTLGLMSGLSINCITFLELSGVVVAVYDVPLVLDVVLNNNK